VGREADPVLTFDPEKVYVPPMTRRGRFDGEIVTLVIHKLGVIDIRWNEELGQWAWLRVRRSFLSSE
jgi:hypothetical protein